MRRVFHVSLGLLPTGRRLAHLADQIQRRGRKTAAFIVE